MALKHFLCGLLRGHDRHLQSTPTEVFVGCKHCGKRSPGWQIDEARMAKLEQQRHPKKALNIHRVLLMKKPRGRKRRG